MNSTTYLLLLLLQIKTGTEKPGFYAIASAPKGNGRFEFLVKENEFNKGLTEVITTCL
jgi:hypothetical protein